MGKLDTLKGQTCVIRIPAEHRLEKASADQPQTLYYGGREVQSVSPCKYVVLAPMVAPMVTGHHSKLPCSVPDHGIVS